MLPQQVLVSTVAECDCDEQDEAENRQNEKLVGQCGMDNRRQYRISDRGRQYGETGTRSLP
ncbi:MAG: hypothetical protein AAFV33_25995, partial [Chloroflexota bacterium]